MNTDETEEINKKLKIPDTKIKKRSSFKTNQNQKSFFKSLSLQTILSEDKKFAPIETNKTKNKAKRLITKSNKHQQATTLSLAQSAKSSLSLSPPLSSSTTTTSASTTSPFLSSSTLSSKSAFDSRDDVSVNVCCFTNTGKVNQVNLQTTSIATMPARTTAKVKMPTTTAATTRTELSTTKITKTLVDELSSLKLSSTSKLASSSTFVASTETSIPIAITKPAKKATTTTEKTSSSVFNSAKKTTKLTNPLYSSFRRSHSVPMIKFYDVSRQRINSLRSPVECDTRNLYVDSIKSNSIGRTTTATAKVNVFSKNHTHENGANQENRLSNQQRLPEVIATSSLTTATTLEVNLSAHSTGDMCRTTTTTTSTKPTRHNNDVQRSRTPSIREDLRFGCAHYMRRAMFVTPCCNKFYKCRFCHDENESHHFDRKTLNELICSECNTRQKVQEACINCGVRFGKYTCLICNLFDDEDKKQYHCDACGICRIGGAENFFHCKVCDMCLPIQLKIEGHKCVENISRSHCPVCLGDIHTSRIPCHIPDCGHLLHKMCFDQLLASGHYACPTCQTSLIDMTALWEFLDAQALQMPMPKKYENQRINIFCNDCHRASKANFHFIGLKCMECGAYNTTQDIKRRVSLVPDEPNTA